MKKLMFAMAIAATVGFAQAKLTSTGFETYTAGAAVDTDKDDAGEAAESDTRVWVSATDVESTVKAYGVGDAEAKPTITGVTATDLGDNYLAVEGKIERLAQEGGEGVVIGDGLYIDTVVQFTASDADATSPDGIDADNDKLCIWLKSDGESATTGHIVVTAGSINDNEGSRDEAPASYVTDTQIDDKSWHHLQVKVLTEVDEDGWIGDAFVVYIDGRAVSTTTCPFGEDVKDYKFTGRAGNYVGENSWSLFPSIQIAGDGGTITSLTFSGSGSVDNISFTQGTDPNPQCIAEADMPAAVTGLVEGTDAKYGVEGNLEDVAYAFSGDYTITKDTKAGTYIAIATLLEGWAWSDGTTAPSNITWTVASSGSGSDVIDPASGDVAVTVTAADATAAEAAAKKAITVPSTAASAVTAAEYADYFDYSKVDNGNGTFTVSITGVKDTVSAIVLESAVERLTDDKATTIAVPAGLYYSITPSTALPISGTAVKGLSTGGTVTVEKPGTTAGFYEVKVSATPIE